MVNQNNILDILKTSPSVALLKARSSGIIIDFLTRVYGDVAAVSHENIHSLLAEYLNSHGFDEDDESDDIMLSHHQWRSVPLEFLELSGLGRMLSV